MEPWEEYREKIIGLGENSSRKSYYPELQEKLQELEASQANLETIINSTSDSIVIHDRLGRILLLNNQAKKIFNIPKHFEKYTIFDISSKSLNVSVLFKIWEDIVNGSPQTIEWLVKPLGMEEEIPVQVSLNRTNWYGATAIVAIVRDFSERKRYENELLIAKKKAEESDRLKSVFLANLSHEIRTPMNAILGFSGLLGDDSLSAEKKESFLKIIQNSGNHLLSIINDIIEISKIETNQVVPNFGPVNINKLLNDLSQVFTVISRANNVELRLRKPAGELFVITDEVKLQQILTNLLSNAFKFTEQGYVEFGCNEKDMLEFYVQDTGVGIQEKYFSIIFERFRQIDNEISFHKGGSGLGLAISKAYAEMLGGNISLESEVNKGTRFSVTIPLKTSGKTVQENQSETVTQVSDSNAIILVAEDDDTNYLYLSEILSRNSFKILRAVNGKVAIDMLSQFPEIDLVLMDIKMPVMNGFESLKVIRSQMPEIPVIAQTAYALPEDEERIRSAGFNGYITKPVSKDKLLKIIEEALV